MNYQALDIIDFVWSTSPKFLLKTRKWNNTDISLYIQESHKSLENRYIESAIKALDYLDKHIGSYPYPNLTIVDPPFNGIKSGGMEYPGLITGFAFLKLPKNIRSLEAVVIHETIHQYFMGLIASNEFEEAWLDEGFTAYLETRIMDEIYGENKSIINFMGVQIGDLTIQRDAYLHGPNAKAAETFRFSWDFPNNSYAELCYSKPAIFLTTLERILGRKLMDKILQEYFNKFKFKHPCSQDFIKIAKETSQKEGFNNSDFFDSFFNQFLYESTTCDYELCKITNKEIIGKVGAFDKQTTKVIKLNSDNGKEIYRSSVVLKRNGELTIPTEVLITFDSGEKMIKLWDGKARYKEFTFEGNSQIISAQIDPSNKIMIDSDLNNNSKTTDPKNFGIWKYVAKFLFWLQNIMQSVAFFA